MIKNRLLSAVLAAVTVLSLSAAPIQSATDGIFSDISVSAESAVRVMFDPAGGECGETFRTVLPGNAYGTLPVPTRTGYVFVGWYSETGELVTEADICSGSGVQILTAVWKERTSCTLTFDANGGSATSKTVKYNAGTKIGSLPVARKSGYTFKGWYTKKSGGTRINANTVLKVVDNRTFYAQYSVPTLATLKYSFDNSTDSYGYDYNIPYSVYKYMLGVKEGRQMYEEFKYDWGGNCFGMSSTSAFLNTGKVKVQSFNRDVYFIKNLSLDDYNSSLGMTVCQFIECMQVAQYTDTAQYLYIYTRNDYSGLAKLVKACQEGKGKPVVVSTLDFTNSGHAVVAYKIKTVSAKEDRIYVYDCNWPDKTQYISLYKNSKGKYTGFSFDLGFEVMSTDYGSTISYFKYDELWNIWTNRVHKTKYSTLTISSENAEIYTAAGTLCARIKDGVFSSTSENVFEGSFADTEYSGKIIYLPKGDYTVINKDGGDFDVSLSGDEALCSVTTDSATVRLYAEDDSGVEISASEGDSYDVVIVTDEGEYSDSGSAETDGRIVVDDETSAA